MTETAPGRESVGVRSVGQLDRSDVQRRMWLAQTADPSSVVFNMSASYRLTGELVAARVKTALAAVARRHEILRTTYRVDDSGALQRTVHPDLLPRFTEHDLTGLGEQARNLRLEVLAQREFGGAFDLRADAPLRMTLIRTASVEHVMLLVAHHIAWDDESWRVFLADLTYAYDNPIGYAQRPVILSARRQATFDRDGAADLRHWRAVMTDLPEPLELPGPNGAVVPRTSRAGLCARALSADTMNRVNRFAKDAGASAYMVMAAAVSALIARYAQADDFLIAAPMSDRTSGTEDSIGYFGNTVVLRARVTSRDTFRELLARTRDAVLDATAHKGAALESVIRSIHRDRGDGGLEDLARLSFGLRDSSGRHFCPEGVWCDRAGVRGQAAQLPLGLTLELTAEGAVVEAEYLIEVLDHPLTAQLLKHLEQMLESALAQPDEAICTLDMLGADSVWLDRVSRGEALHAAPTTLAEIVQRQVEATPAAIAMTYEGRDYTYRQLNEQANQLAHWLIESGLGPEDTVAVLLQRSPELVLAALAISKAGAVYLPVDPDYPVERIEAILADSTPKLVLREAVGALGGYPTSNPTDADRVRPLRPDNLAYIIYTSGSTGAPKGVAVPHAPVTEYIAWFGRDYLLDGREAVLQVASTSFDASIEEIFGTLGSGARLVIPRPGGLRDVGYLTDLLRHEGITAMHLVPSLLGLFLSLPGASQWRTLRRVPVGGEALPGELADKFHATFDALLHNFYGPTEAAIAATKFTAAGKQGNRIVPIGRPKVNTTVHLLDHMLRPLPVGAIGEIYIGGTCLARGYADQPALTAERFVADPYRVGGRLYRSGDLARRNADGDLEFVGRADEQVKVRGLRIELGEVSAAASVDPSVGQCVVAVRELAGRGRCLVAYLTPSSDSDTVDVERVRTRVSAALPEYMAPAAYVVLDAIPITTHGKIDRDALPEPHLEPGAANRAPNRPAWGPISSDDPFFHDVRRLVLATKLIGAIRAEHGVEVGIRDVLDPSTAARLAALIDRGNS